MSSKYSEDHEVSRLKLEIKSDIIMFFVWDIALLIVLVLGVINDIPGENISWWCMMVSILFCACLICLCSLITDQEKLEKLRRDLNGTK